MITPEDEATKQGNLLRDEGDFDGAIAAYTEAIRLNPQNVTVLQPGPSLLAKRRIGQGHRRL